MTRRALVNVLAGLTAALVVPPVAGCSSPDGCRTCRTEPSAPARPPQAAAADTAATGATPPGQRAAAPYGGQKTCPVTGEELGTMGKPVAVTVKGETVYVCCRGCAAKAQADSERTLAAVAAERAR